MGKPGLYVGARVAVKTIQFLSGRRRYPGRVGTVEEYGRPLEKTGDLWLVTLDAIKDRKTKTNLFYGVDLELIL